MRACVSATALVAVSAAWAVSGCGSVQPAGAADSGSDNASAGGSGGGNAGTGTGGTSGAGSGGATGSGGGIAGTGGGGTASDAGSSDTSGGGGVPPGAFVLKTPADGSPGVTATPTLTWAAAVGATSYQVEVATSASFGEADLVNMPGVTGTSVVLAMPLRPGVLYAWRVTAVSGTATTVASNAPFWMASPVAAGSNPYGIAVTPSGAQAVVANNTSPGSVTFLDLTSFTMQAISVAGTPSILAITPDGSTALVTQGAPNAVAVVDFASRSVTGTIAPPCVATTLYGIAIKPDGSAAVMPDFNGGCTKDVLDVIPLPGTTIASAIDLASSASAFGVAVTPDSATALVTRGILGTSIKSVDLASGGVSTVTGTSASFGVAVTPNGKEALVTSGGGDTVKRVSLTNRNVVAPISFESNSEVCNVAITPNGRLAVVVGSFNIGVLRLADNAVAATYSGAGRCVAITPDGTRALITGAGSGGKVFVLKLP